MNRRARIRQRGRKRDEALQNRMRTKRHRSRPITGIPSNQLSRQVIDPKSAGMMMRLLPMLIGSKKGS